MSLDRCHHCGWDAEVDAKANADRERLEREVAALREALEYVSDKVQVTTFYVDHKDNAFRKAVEDLLALGREAGYTWVKAEYEHPRAGLRGSSSWGSPRPPPSQGHSEERK